MVKLLEFTKEQRLQELNLIFFAWSDSVGAPLNISQVEKTYLDWCEHLLQRFRVVKDMNQLTAYNRARLAGQILDGVLGRTKPIVRMTRLRKPNPRKTHINFLILITLNH
jgi:hypothetical protein